MSRFILCIDTPYSGSDSDEGVPDLPITIVESTPGSTCTTTISVDSHGAFSADFEDNESISSNSEGMLFSLSTVYMILNSCALLLLQLSVSEYEENEVWDSDSEETCGDEFDNDEAPDLPLNQESRAEERDLVVWLLIFILRLQAKHYIPDVALTSLIKFLFIFFSVIGRTSSYVATIASSFPKSLRELRQRFGFSQKFKKLVVCLKCHSVYDFSECVEICGLIKHSRKCNNREHKNSSKKCEQVLLKTVELSRGNTLLRPFKVYCYRSVGSSLQCLLQCETFISSLEGWRLRQEVTDTLSDVYDGQLWKDFMYFEGVPFLARPYCLALAMNIDWFQPYKWTESSVGAIYLTVLNLPYHLRFKREFVILAGIIPGPREPKRDINSYLRPLVGELLDLWNGVSMPVLGEDKEKNIRCALIVWHVICQHHGKHVVFSVTLLSLDVPSVKRYFQVQSEIKITLVLIERTGSPGVIVIIVHALLRSINLGTKLNVICLNPNLVVDTLSYLTFHTLILCE